MFRGVCRSLTVGGSVGAAAASSEQWLGGHPSTYTLQAAQRSLTRVQSCSRAVRQALLYAPPSCWLPACLLYMRYMPAQGLDEAVRGMAVGQTTIMEVMAPPEGPGVGGGCKQCNTAGVSFATGVRARTGHMRICMCATSPLGPKAPTASPLRPYPTCTWQ